MRARALGFFRTASHSLPVQGSSPPPPPATGKALRANVTQEPRGLRALPRSQPCPRAYLCCCSTSSSMPLPSQLPAPPPCRPGLCAGSWKACGPPREARLEDEGWHTWRASPLILFSPRNPLVLAFFLSCCRKAFSPGGGKTNTCPDLSPSPEPMACSLLGLPGSGRSNGGLRGVTWWDEGGQHFPTGSRGPLVTPSLHDSPPVGTLSPFRVWFGTAIPALKKHTSGQTVDPSTPMEGRSEQYRGPQHPTSLEGALGEPDVDCLHGRGLPDHPSSRSGPAAWHLSISWAFRTTF